MPAIVGILLVLFNCQGYIVSVLFAIDLVLESYIVCQEIIFIIFCVFDILGLIACRLKYCNCFLQCSITNQKCL